MERKKIKSFTDLIVWQEGHKLVLEIYKMTKVFPKEELYGLVSQMRRAAVSVTSNIAEGFSRRSYKEKTRFYRQGLGSLTELQNQLLISRDLSYIKSSSFDVVVEQMISVHKLFNRLIKSSQGRIKK